MVIKLSKEKKINEYETYAEILEALKKDGLTMVMIVVISWMSLHGIKPEDKIPNDWKEGINWPI